MNKVILMGRLTRDVEMRQTPNGVSLARFSIAVNRRFAGKDAQQQADFINCVAWRQQAEFISKYFGKGRMIALEGNLRTRTYDDRNGTKHYVTEVFVDSVSFTGEKAQQSGNSSYSGSYSNSYSNQNSAPRQASQPAYNEPSQKPIAIGDLDDFEEILGDDGVPF